MSDGTSGGSFFDDIAEKADGFVEESRGNGPEAAAGEAEEEADVGDIGDRLRGAFSKADGDDDGDGGSWEPYEGPQGGVGWENQETGEVSYSDEAPGETPEGVPSSASEIEEMIESGEMDDNALEGGEDADEGGGSDGGQASGGTEPGDTVRHEGEEREVVDVNDDGNPVVEGDDGELEEVTDDSLSDDEFAEEAQRVAEEHDVGDAALMEEVSSVQGVDEREANAPNPTEDQLEQAARNIKANQVDAGMRDPDTGEKTPEHPGYDGGGDESGEVDDKEAVDAMQEHGEVFSEVKNNIVENATEETAELIGDDQQNEARGLGGAEPGEVVRSYLDDPGRGEILPEMMPELAETTDDPEGVMEPATRTAEQLSGADGGADSTQEGEGDLDLDVQGSESGDMSAEEVEGLAEDMRSSTTENVYRRNEEMYDGIAEAAAAALEENGRNTSNDDLEQAILEHDEYATGNDAEEIVDGMAEDGLVPDPGWESRVESDPGPTEAREGFSRQDDRDPESERELVLNTMGPFSHHEKRERIAEELASLPDGADPDEVQTALEDADMFPKFAEDFAEDFAEGLGELRGGGGETEKAGADGGALATGKAFVEGSMPEPGDAADGEDPPPQDGDDGGGTHQSSPMSR